MRAVKDLKSNVPIFFDGGVRKGSDVLKAIALGADCVFIGLACDGQAGVEKVINILNNELKQSMLVTGCMSISDVKENREFMFYDKSEHIFKL